jgi:glycosyltransferase involved in cell wall biosynthesis
MSNYVIITPANNEAAFIEQTIAAVIAQTVRPLKWVIVNDASTDQTREIVESHARQHNFIELVNVQRAAGRHFGNKVRAFNTGLECVKDLKFDFIGNLDADMSFEPDYFQNLLQQFELNPKLGIGGGMVHTTIDGKFVSQEVALDSVAGAVQLFRRKCFEQVGGYRAMPLGGIDAAAEVAARMHGWQTRTFPELVTREHRFTGAATASPLKSRLKEGKRMYSLGYSPIFFFVRCIYRLLERPAVIGSVAALWGYFMSAISSKPVAVSPEAVRYLRSEQHAKLKRLLGFKTA